ncbi:MAG TPA: SRPBCC domain-containing protein [Puia sp.]|nr:SRPBCC domain-containing protein [Puia sp.]
MSPLFDFHVDKEKKAIYITREFAADRDLVWDAFTKPEIVVQWTAPKPLRAYIKEMDFREGGRCLTAMLPPEKITRWSLQEYTNINPKSSFTTRNSFVDENFNPLNNGSSITTNSFEPGTGKTTVRIEKLFDSLATVEMMATNGFKEGMAEAMKNLDEYLRTALVAK